MASILVLNGPNLNLLGKRQPEIYGHETLADVEVKSTAQAKGMGFETRCLQSNHEGQLVDWIQEARGDVAGIVINPGAYTHTSVAILDALNMFEGPVIEVHISQVHKRESFRHHSYVSGRANGVIAGMGGTQRLTKLVGKSKAMDMNLTGRFMDAEEAERSGLVSRVVPVKKLMEEAMAAAGKIAEKSMISATVVKECVNRAYEVPLSEGLLFERRMFHSLFNTEDQKEGMSAFLEKREAQFRDK